MQMKIIITFFVITCSIGLIASPNDAFATTSFVDAFPVSDEETTPLGLAFNSDGTKMFVLGSGNVNEYACSTGFDVSTCSIASPIIPSPLFKELKQKFSEVYAIDFPDSFVSVSEFYDNFDQVGDEIVLDILSNY